MTILLGKELSSISAIGKRIQKVRIELLDFSRAAFCKHIHISAQTLKGWELGWGGGPTENSIKKLSNDLKSIGVFCSEAWLKHGIGPQASFYNGIISYTNEDILAAAEIVQFRENTPTKTIDTIIRDVSLSPLVIPGDYVAGVALDNPAKAIGKECIIITTSNLFFTKVVRQGSQLKMYDLECLSPENSDTIPIVRDVEIAYAAPITRIYRKTNLQYNDLIPYDDNFEKK